MKFGPFSNEYQSFWAYRDSIVLFSILSVCIALGTNGSARAIEPSDANQMARPDHTTRSPAKLTSNRTPIIESTGFESPDWDSFTVGQSNFFCGSAYWNTCTATPIAPSCTGNPSVDVNCCSAAPNSLNGWFASDGSQQCHEPHIETANPATGAQHLRFSHDATGGDPMGCVGMNAGCHIDASTPDMGPQVLSPFTVSFDLSISNTFGQNFQYYTMGTEGNVGTNMYFYSGGVIYIYDFADSINHPVGAWTPGSYHHVRIEKDFCNNRSVSYFYDDAMIYQTTSDATKTIERAVMQSDNGGSSGDFVDVDNYSVIRAAVQCVAVCGNGTVEPSEECEPGVSGNCPPGRCIPAGQPDACTCASVCATGEACDDGIACTVDTCESNTCVHAANDTLCDDHLVCNGSETCDANLGCRPGTPLQCDDHDACTNDSCSEPNGCAHSTINCDNGQFCDGVETCDPIAGCVAGAPPNCDDGLFCNGQESCTASGCTPGTPPCATNQTCDEDTRECTTAFTAIPTVSQWGLCIMALVILIIVKIRNLRGLATGR